jgi:hypothetical protein
MMSDPIKTRQDLVDWIEHCVLGDLRTLLQGIAYYYDSEDHRSPDGRALGGGNFLLAAACCMALDYFGFIFHGGSSDEANVRAFVDKFLVSVNPRYSEAMLLMWKCFRQGTVHRSWPQRIYVENDYENHLIAGVGSAAGGIHLDADSTLERDSFVINAWQLFTDIEAAFDTGFRTWILEEATDSILQRANPQPLKIRQGDRQAMEQFEKVRRWHREQEK